MKPSSSQDRKLIDLLKEMETHRAEYPEELLSARRAAFLDQVDQYDPRTAAEPVPSADDQKVIDLLSRLKSLPEKYPSNLFTARRAAFKGQLAWMNWVILWTAMRSALEKKISTWTGSPWKNARKVLPVSLMIASFVLAASAGMLFYEKNDPLVNLLRPSHGIVKAAHIITTDNRVEKIVCKPGYVPPLCLAATFNSDDDLTFQGNGTARPAVAKDTLPGHGVVHKAAYLNDGMYGPGASWISNSKNSWIKIDLGQVTAVNTIKFGRDRLGELNDGDPGRFVIAVALADNVYSDGNSSNDNLEYTLVYDSQKEGFTGKILGAETVTAQFQTIPARFIKITFQNKGTAIDEVEAYMMPPSNKSGSGVVATSRPKKSRENPTPTVASMPLPTNTALPIPADTATPYPTSTPTDTAAPLPTSTPAPTDTPTPTNTRHPTKTPTPTSTPLPTSTSTPTSTYTPVPTDPPTSTYTPVPTDTPTTVPTDTPLPTDTPTPVPTESPVPTDTQAVAPATVDPSLLSNTQMAPLTSFP